MSQDQANPVEAAPVRRQIFKGIEVERIYQDTKWGTTFDDQNTANDWAKYVNDYASKASPLVVDQQIFETNMLKVATLAVAAIETSRRNGGPAPRHYDKVLV